MKTTTEGDKKMKAIRLHEFGGPNVLRYEDAPKPVDMKRLFDCAHDARIILSGDTGQHASVARGDALRILERHSDFKSGQLTAIRRQRKADYRKAVELAAQKRTVEAFAQLERMATTHRVSV
jgi:hypothetical protein